MGLVALAREEAIHPLKGESGEPRGFEKEVITKGEVNVGVLMGWKLMFREFRGYSAGEWSLRFEVWGSILRVLDSFRPRGATWSGQVISSPPGPSGGPSKTHLLPGGGVYRVDRTRSPVPPRLPRSATPRSVHQFAAVAAGAYPPRRPPNAWSPGAPAPLGPCYWLVASGTPLGWRGGCLA